MSDKKLNAIKEIEFRIRKVVEILNNPMQFTDLYQGYEEIDTLLFDINDFINDLKDE
jgi:hypothetical protein